MTDGRAQEIRDAMRIRRRLQDSDLRISLKSGKFTLFRREVVASDLTVEECEPYLRPLKRAIGASADNVGKTYGKLTVTSKIELLQYGRRSAPTFYSAECECGSVVQVRGADLRAGRATSCKKCEAA